jgi:hypothetical protein
VLLQLTIHREVVPNGLFISSSFIKSGAKQRLIEGEKNQLHASPPGHKILRLEY